MATLSIVVPVHGVAAYLPACLDSILADAPEDLQVVAVDDASPDGCAEILAGYTRRDARMRVVRLHPNRGLGEARNVGLEAATGEYVWFVDGDDRLAPGAVPAVVARIDSLSRRGLRPDVLLLNHVLLHDDGRADIDPSGVRVRRLAGTVAVRERPRLLGARQAAWNRVVRRGLLDRIGLRFPSGWYEDVAFSQLVLIAAERVATLARVAYLYRQRSTGAITGTVSPRHFEVFGQYEALFTALDAWPVRDAVRAHLFELMIEHYLVIVGSPDRVPADLRPAFFGRMVEHYHRFLPAGGYEPPRGLGGVKYRFVRWDAYAVFAAARNVYRAGKRAHRAVTSRSARTTRHDRV